MPQLNKLQKEIAILSGALILVLCGIFATVLSFKNTDGEEKIVMAIETQNTIVLPTVKTPDIKVKAKAAYVVDLNTGAVLFSKNENTPLPLASLTKIMTAIVAKKNTTDAQLVKITDADIATEGEYFLIPQEIFKLKDLIDLTLVGSVNDTASAISGVLQNKKSFIAEMNNTAKQIGLSESTFKNETGLDISSSTASANGSAKDVATMLNYAITNFSEIFDSTTQESVTVYSLDGITHKVKNTNDIVDRIPGLLASKTGYTDLAGGNLAVIVDVGLNEPVAIVVLGSPNNETRFTDVLAILESIKK